MLNNEAVNLDRGTVVPDGAEVKRRRMMKGFTQAQLSKVAKVSERTIQNIENGQPTLITTLQTVAQQFETLLADLVCAAARAHFLPHPVSPRGASRAAPEGVPAHRPQQLPPDLPDFVGRADEMERMIARLASTGGPVELSAVNGMGGVGKTSLAVQVGHKVKDWFHSGQLFLDLRGMHPEPLTATQAMGLLLKALRPEASVPENPDSLACEYRTLMTAGGRLLLVLDNAAGAEQVRPLLAGPPAGVIITSRHALSLSEYGVESVSIDALSPQEAFALLRKLVGQSGTNAEIQAVVQLCGHLPLAVRVAGDFLRQRRDWTVAEYVDALRREGLRRLKTTGDRDVEAVLRLSAAQLVRESLERATRWALLAAFEESFDRDMAAAVWEVTPDDLSVHDDLSELTARSMLLYDTKADRYQMHDLMRPIAAGLFCSRDGA